MTNKQISKLFLRVVNTDIDVDALRTLLRKAKIDEEKGCWFIKDWSVYRTTTTVHGKILVHRFTYWAFYHKIPENLLGCHKCDRPGCFNPDHIFPGTSMENFHDAVKKKRISKGCRKVTDDSQRISSWYFDSIFRRD